LPLENHFVIENDIFSFKMAGITEAQLKLVADLEMEMMADMYNR
jgi:hypothetical protein